jgi:hypothetical protein
MKTVLVQWIDGGLISLLRISSLIQLYLGNYYHVSLGLIFPHPRMHICCFELPRYGNVFENFCYCVHKGHHWTVSFTKQIQSKSTHPSFLKIHSNISSHVHLGFSNGLFFLVFIKNFVYISHLTLVCCMPCSSLSLVKLTYYLCLKHLKFEVHKKFFFFSESVHFFQRILCFTGIFTAKLEYNAQGSRKLLG